MDTGLTIEDILESESPDLELDEGILDEIARKVIESFEKDKGSRAEWEKVMEEANDLALQVKEEKNWPWPKAANVKFPALTTASVQFNARAMPSLVGTPDVVKCRVIGEDPTGEKRNRAERVSRHMSWQVIEQDEDWEKEMDRLLMVLPIAGCAFKKVYYDPMKGHNCSQLVLPKDFVVDYYATDLKGARKTHVISMSPQEVRERQLMGQYRDIELDAAPTKITAKDKDRRQGTSEPQIGDDTYRTVLEQHTYLDLDGDDLAEPYVVKVDYSSGKLLQIAPRFSEASVQRDLKSVGDEIQAEARVAEEVVRAPNMPDEVKKELLLETEQRIMEIKASAPIVRIEPDEYFVKYSFIPSPDGGFYELGFGRLLGPINETINTTINQLLDAGTMSNLGGGFLGRGARVRSGKLRFEPGEWKRVDATGTDLKNNIVPLPVPQPSQVLFSLLGLLIDYAERITSVTDMMAGQNPGQNTPATTSMAMLEQGLKVFSGIFKRVYLSMRDEFRLLYKLNGRYLSEMEYFEVLDTKAGEPGQVFKNDYQGDPKDIAPAADRNAVSSQERIMKADMLFQRAMAVPGYNTVAIERMWLEAMGVPNSQELYDPEQFQPGPDPQLQLDAAEQERKTLESQTKGEIERARLEIDAATAEADIAKKEADILLSVAKAKKEVASIETDAVDAVAKLMKEKREQVKDARERSQGVAERSSGD